MNDKDKALLALIIASFSISTAPTLVRLALESNNSATFVATSRLLLATIIMGISGLIQKTLRLKLKKDTWLLLILSGFFLAIHFSTWMASINLTTLAASTVLVTTSPLFVALFGYVFLGDKLRIPQTLAIVIGMAASIAIGLEHVDTLGTNLTGSILALIGAITVAIYFTIGRQQRQQLSLSTYTTLVYGSATLFLLIFLALGVFESSLAEFLTVNSYDFILLVTLAIFPSCLGHSLYNYALKELKGAIVSLTFLTETIGSILLAALLFEEFPSIYFYFFASILIGSVLGLVYYDSRERKRKENINN